MKKTIITLLFIAVVATANGQQPIANGLNLDIDAEGFFYDAEYGTPFAKGYTVTGFRLSPTLVYGINERAQLRVGFNATLFAGMDSLYKLRPTLTLLYKPANWLTFVAGTLVGTPFPSSTGAQVSPRAFNHSHIHTFTHSHIHDLPSPVIDPARHIFNYQEDGIQILTDTKIWNSDTWLDWTHYLVPWTPDQELFTMGTRHKLTILNSQFSIFNFQLSAPAHFMASHRGGEVKTIDTNTVTTFNESIGLRFEFSNHNSTSSHLHHFTLDLPVLFYHLEDNDLDHGGKAFYPTLSYQYSQLSILNSHFSIFTSLGFWHGDHYFSAYGSPLFWSINNYSRQHIPFTPSTTDADIRYLLTYTLSIGHSFKGVALGLKVDALHDLDLKTNDFIFSFFLRFNGQFKIL